MSEDWATYRSSPLEGTVLGKIGDLPEGTTLSREIFGQFGAFPVVIAPLGGSIRAFVNLCPHQDLPLDYRSTQILSADGQRLICSSHNAEFRLTDGVAIRGPCVGRNLDAIPVVVDADGAIRIRRSRA
jgi:nitrite reductase/ring-hydroxylating ferredoxin subunit